MKFIFDTKYSEIELEFLNRHNCQILSEIQLSKTDFPKHEIPRRMFRYGGEYIGEICDGEGGRSARRGGVGSGTASRRGCRAAQALLGA